MVLSGQCSSSSVSGGEGDNHQLLFPSAPIIPPPSFPLTESQSNQSLEFRGFDQLLIKGQRERNEFYKEGKKANYNDYGDHGGDEMNIPGNSSIRGYYQVPTKPPDHGAVPLPLDVKGEYIEEYDEIKEERSEVGVTTSAPVAMYPPLSLAYNPPPPPLIMTNMPSLQPTTFSNSLSPLELITKLSNYAASSRKRVAMPTNLTSPAKKFQPQQTFQPPKIQNVVSLNPSAPRQPTQVSPIRQNEPNNNSNTDNTKTDSTVEIPDLTQPQKSMIDCPVCGDIAVAHFHYGGMCCYSCKAFFRRVVNTNKATKYKCRAGNSQCDVSLANRRSCQACRYKKCVAAGMKPGLVLSDDQCQKKFGPKKGADKSVKTMSKARSDDMEEDVDDPEDVTKDQEDQMKDDDYSVLIDPSKSLSEQNKVGRQLFISLFSTGSVSSGQCSQEELEIFDNIDRNSAMFISNITERQVQNSRKFLSFHQNNRNVFLSNGQINTSDVIQTLMEQTVLVLKQNKDFQTLSTKDQTELLESNAMVVSLLTNIELYQVPSKTIAWSLTETDYQALRKQAVEAQNGRAVFGLSDVNLKVEADLRDDIGKLFKFFDYFYLIGVPKSALFILAMVAVFCHDCCDIENKDRVEQLRRRNLIILYEVISQTEGVLGACKLGLKLHQALHHLNRICQLLAQKFISVKD